jgi:hypothetical protein
MEISALVHRGPGLIQLRTCAKRDENNEYDPSAARKLKERLLKFARFRPFPFLIGINSKGK